jgi:hypothetical protein
MPLSYFRHQSMEEGCQNQPHINFRIYCFAETHWPFYTPNSNWARYNPTVMSFGSKSEGRYDFLWTNGVPKGGGVGVWEVQTPLPPKFRSFDKAEPNSQYCGKSNI